MSVAPASTLRERVLAAALRQAAWLESFGPVSQDQYDLWASAAGRRAKKWYYERPALGLFAAAPFVLLDNFFPGTRRFFRSRSRFPIADSHWAMGFYLLAQATGDRTWEQRGETFLRSLLAERCPGYSDYCWGYPFDWETCFGTFPAETPLITTIPYAYDAIESACAATGSGDLLPVLESVATFASRALTYSVPRPHTRASAYTPHDARRVVNASSYRAWLLTNAGVRFGRSDWIDEGIEYAAFVLDSQQADGSWLYAVDGKDAFVDNFHTCFVIKNLVKIARKVPDRTESAGLLQAALRGYGFYKHWLLDADGQPKPFAKTQRLSLVRRELYDYAEGINLAGLMKGHDPEAGEIQRRLVERLLGEWQLPDGRFVTRRMVVGANRVPYHRWAQSQTFRSLCQLLVEEA